MIRTAALRTQGGAGPSGVDAAGWRRLCTAFHGASRDLCNSVAQLMQLWRARRIATTYVDPAGLSAFIACRLIPLDKRRYTLLLLLFASTKFCDFGIPTILRVLIFAISRGQAKFCDFTQPKVKRSTLKSAGLVNMAVCRLKFLHCEYM